MTSREKPAYLARPENWAAVTTIEAHTGGEPLRVITGGLPKIPGDTILAKRRWAMKNLDHLRTGNEHVTGRFGHEHKITQGR